MRRAQWAIDSLRNVQDILGVLAMRVSVSDYDACLRMIVILGEVIDELEGEQPKYETEKEGKK